MRHRCEYTEQHQSGLHVMTYEPIDDLLNYLIEQTLEYCHKRLSMIHTSKIGRDHHGRHLWIIQTVCGNRVKE